ncbi:MAG: hypothetical protein JWN76_940 [Chitinophagaceae bacterium]|nr:hypothetical protein [Chitinophagaceae bacterium]
MLLSFANNKDGNSLASKSRKKRFEFFKSNLKTLTGPVKILDIGGTQEFWQSMGNTSLMNITIDLLNLEHQKTEFENFRSIKGNATNLSELTDKSYDIVFSNSVIEHLHSWENQVKMAKEVLRVGKNYFIQTPNYWFPIEPHYVFPLFQYLPFALKISLLRRCNLGHIKRIKNREKAIEQIKETRLLTIQEMQQLFPGCNIYLDKFLGFNKSIVAYSFKGG